MRFYGLLKISVFSCLLLSSISLAQQPDPRKTSTPSPDAPETSPETRKGAETVTGENGEELLKLNSVDVDVRQFIEQIRKFTKKDFLIPQQLSGKVTLLTEKRMNKEEAYQALLSALEVLGYTVVEGPGNLVKIVPLKEALENPIPIYKGDSPYTDSFITRIIPLKNVNVLDISNAIKPLVSKEGNLFAYPATNTLIVTDSGSNIERLMKILREMDIQGPGQVVEIITLKNASAKDVADKVQRIYLEQASPQNRRPPSGQRGELEDVADISKVIADERTNSIIVLGSKRGLAKIRPLIIKLDRPLEGAQGRVHVHYLRHAEAKKMAEVLSALTTGTGGRTTTTNAPQGGGQGQARSGQPGAPAAPIVAEFEGGVKITADEPTNSLVITSTQKDYETLVNEVINKLDIPRRQVYVEAIIMELRINKNRDFGVNGQVGGTLGKLLPFATTFGGPSAVLPSLLSATGSVPPAAGGVISNSTIDFPRGDGTTVKLPSFGAILTALQQDTNVNVLSTPNILTLDNEEAEINVGQEVPFPSGSTLTTGGNTSFSVTRQNVGITLKITPQVNEGDTVKMKIKQEITQVQGNVSAEILTTIGPTTSKRAVQTVVVAKDQQTIVIGGLIDDQTVMSQTKVPFLGDIPLLGNLFKRKSTQKAKTNILVFLRPYIIRDTEDFMKILHKKVEERNVFVEQNYGKGQQRAIRDSIRSHASELLEFKKEIQQQQYEPDRNSSDAR